MVFENHSSNLRGQRKTLKSDGGKSPTFWGLVKIHGLQPVWSGYQKEPKQVGTRIAREVGPWKISKASFEDMNTQRNSVEYCCNSHKMSQIPGPYKPVPPPNVMLVYNML